MLAALLSLLGVGGIAGIALHMFGWGGTVAKVKSAASKVPPKVWFALAIAAALFVGYLVHQHHAHKALKAAHDAGYAEGVRDTKAAYRAAQAAANAQAEKINSKVRKQTDVEAHRINRSADALLLRGAGKARCGGPAAASGPSGRQVAASGPADAAVGPVPDRGGSELIAMPFDDALAFAREHDLDLNEVKGWREADDKQRSAAEQSKAEDR